MKLLLDTHTLLWMGDQSDNLSETAAKALLDGRNKLFLSMASWWEISIKVGLGKLALKKDWAVTLKREIRHNEINWLPIRPEHCERILLLPFHHRDPFDRLLIAQAQCEGLTLVSSDRQILPYGIAVLW